MIAIEKLREMGLTHWWNFDSNYLERLSNVSLTNQLGVSFVSDRYNASHKAVSLTKGKMTIPNNFKFYGGDLSITVWVYVLSYESWSQRVIDCGSFELMQSNVILALQKDDTKLSYFEIWNNKKNNDVRSNSSIPLNTWTHLAATLSNSMATIWYNAVQQAQTKFTISLPQIEAKNNYIGRSHFVFKDANANAYYDDLMFFNKGLSQSQLELVRDAYVVDVY